MGMQNKTSHTLHIVTSDGVSFPVECWHHVHGDPNTEKVQKNAVYLWQSTARQVFGVIAFIKLQNSFLKDCPENSHVVIFPNK